MSPPAHRLAIVVATPAHRAVGGPLTYASEPALAPGALVRVPLGRREVLGVVWGDAAEPADGRFEEKTVTAPLTGIPPLAAGWRQLVAFAASYYQRSIGEVALAALPPQLRELSPEQWARRMKRPAADNGAGASEQLPTLTDEQSVVLEGLRSGPGP